MTQRPEHPSGVFDRAVVDHAEALRGAVERFVVSLPPPEDAEVERVVGQVARRIARLLERRGLGPEADPSEVDPLAEDEPLLAQLYGASVASRIENSLT